MIGSVLRIRYEVLEQTGSGPVFQSFKARDKVQGRDVTVRLFRPPFAQEPEFVEAIRDVVARNARLYGPGVEAMMEVDDHDGQPFLVSEYSPGQPLQERIEKLAPFSVSVAVSTAISICEALNSLHLSGVAHGDVSAQNIIALPDGQCRLQLPGLWESYSASQTAGVVALPAMAAYLAPEVSAGGMPSPSSDVYSVGILLYQLLSGRLPYSADTPVAMALKHATAGIPSVKIYNSAVVGGKVGVDLPQGKNLAGAFHPPQQVLVCTEALATLDPRQFRNGMAEVWKYGFIGDAELVQDLSRMDLHASHPEIEKVVAQCIRQKRDVVEADEYETTGLRATLNFGHTVGHAIEQVGEYKLFLHGEAISIGMVVETVLGERLGITAKGTAKEVREILARQGLPVATELLENRSSILAAMKRDKKAKEGKLAFSFLTKLGACKLFEDVPEGEVASALSDS